MGFPITEELAPTDLQAAVIKRLRNSVRELLSNVTLRECGLALQRDFIKRTVWGSTQHLLAVTPTSRQFEKKINNTLIDAAAGVLQTRRQFLGLTGLEDLRILNAEGTIMRAFERARLHAAAH